MFKDKYFGFENGQYHEGVGISPPWVCHPIGVYLAEGATETIFFEKKLSKKNPEITNWVLKFTVKKSIQKKIQILNNDNIVYPCT